MDLSFLRRGGYFDFGIAARVNEIGAKDRDRYFHAIWTLSIPAHFPDRFFVDLLLQFDHARDESLGGWRAAGNVNVHRQELVNARDHVISLFEWAAAGRARAHRYHVFGFRHLIVEANDGRNHLLGDRARDNHDICLAWGGTHDFH